MTNFIDIFESLKKEYRFRIKAIVNLEEKIDHIERILSRYDLIEIGRVKKTIIQDAPLEFTDIDAHEVYIVDVVLGLPISTYSLKVELHQKLNINQDFLVVRSENDPLEIETNRINLTRAMDEENAGLEPAPLLSTDSEMPEKSLPGSLFYGDEFTDEFKRHLSNHANTRHEAGIVRTGNGLFKWLEQDEFVEPAEDYNANIPDAPKVHPRWENTGTLKDRKIDPYVGNSGNLDQDSATYTKRYKKTTTGEKVVSKKSDSLRK